MYSLSLRSRKGTVQTASQDLSTTSSANELQNNLVRMTAASNRTTGEVPSDLSSNVSKLVETNFDVLLRLCENLTGSACARWSIFVTLLKLGIFHGNLLLGKLVQLSQTANLELVQLNAILICSEVEADGDELNDDLLDEVEDESDKQSYKNLVHGAFPFSCGLDAVDVVVRHCWEERHFNGQPPEEQSSWEFELLSHVSPLLAVVGEEGRDETNRPGEEFGEHLRCMLVVVKF